MLRSTILTHFSCDFHEQDPVMVYPAMDGGDHHGGVPKPCRPGVLRQRRLPGRGLHGNQRQNGSGLANPTPVGTVQEYRKGRCLNSLRAYYTCSQMMAHNERRTPVPGGKNSEEASGHMDQDQTGRRNCF